MKSRGHKHQGRRKVWRIMLLIPLFIILIGAVRWAHANIELPKRSFSKNTDDPAYWEGCPDIDVQLLTPSEYTRPDKKRKTVNCIVIHYTANPGSTAQQNHDYFEGLKDTHETKASSHFIVGLDGEVIQNIPCREEAYANYPRNEDSISIECCHPDESGKFTDATYRTVVQLAAWCCKAFNVSPDDVIRHYDVSGKDCPKYYVEHEEAWDQMKQDIADQYQAIIH